MLNKTEGELQGKINISISNAHKYAIHFDIHPEITYLNHDILNTIADLFKLFHNFPNDVWIAQQSVDEGLDFFRIVFWVFSDSSDALKAFGIWFQSLFREAQVTETLERLVLYAIDEHEGIEVELTDWTRLNTLDADIVEVIKKETNRVI